MAKKENHNEPDYIFYLTRLHLLLIHVAALIVFLLYMVADVLRLLHDLKNQV